MRTFTDWLRRKRIAQLLKYLAAYRGTLREADRLTSELREIPLPLISIRLETARAEAETVHKLAALGVPADQIDAVNRRRS